MRIEFVEPSTNSQRSEASAGSRALGSQTIHLSDNEFSTEISICGYTRGDLQNKVRSLASVEARSGAPPIYHFKNLTYFPKLACLYGEDGQRVLETCVRRGPQLEEVGKIPESPERVSIPAGIPRLDRPVIFCGVVNSHWGAFLTEGISRLWVLAESDFPADVPLLWLRWKRLSTPHLDRFLYHAGIKQERILRLDQATTLAEVLVPHPSFAIRSHAFGCHLSLPEQVAEEICTQNGERTNQPVYLSRRLLAESKRRSPGEDMLEEVLQRRGVRVVSPETMSYEDQVRMVNSHELFIGCIGSAFHSLMYARPGRPLRTIVMTNKLLKKRTASYFMIDLLKGIDATYLCDVLQNDEAETLDVEAAQEWLKELSII
jgi:capsular polysaccharide biosynthesis protein